MANLDRTAVLTDAFLQFSKDGKPLSADELVPLGKRIRGPQWDPAKRHQPLAKVDGDCDGLVGSQDFAFFMLGRLATVSDEDFLSAVRRLQRFPKPSYASTFGANDSLIRRILDNIDDRGAFYPALACQVLCRATRDRLPNGTCIGLSSMLNTCGRTHSIERFIWAYTELPKKTRAPW